MQIFVNSVERLNSLVYSAVPPVLLCVRPVLWNAIVHPISPPTTHIYQLPISSSLHRVVELFQAAAYCRYVPSLSFMCSCSCLLWPCDNIVVFFIMVDPVTDFSTLPWLLNRERGPCLAGRHPSRNVFLCVCIVHSVVREDKMVGSQVFPSCSREALFQMH